MCQSVDVLVAQFPARNVVVSKRNTQCGVETVVGISLKMIDILETDTHNQSPATTSPFQENEKKIVVSFNFY